MKVLKKGKAKEWSKKCKCTGNGNGGGGCGAELRVEKSDLFTTHRSFYDGSNESYVTFRCIQCNVLTDIEGVPSTGLPTQMAWERRQNKLVEDYYNK